MSITASPESGNVTVPAAIGTTLVVVSSTASSPSPVVVVVVTVLIVIVPPDCKSSVEATGSELFTSRYPPLATDTVPFAHEPEEVKISFALSQTVAAPVVVLAFVSVRLCVCVASVSPRTVSAEIP